jgi:hypothetical protein
MDYDELTPRRHVPHLLNILKNHPDWTKGAEIGVAQGRTLKAVLETCPNLVMLAVDAWEYVPDSEDTGMYEGMDHALNEQCVRLVAGAFPDRVGILKGYSWGMASLVGDGTLDFVFIDASHAYEEVKADIKCWAPKVKPNGWILGHDYCERWDGVRRAVDELLGPPLELPETLWAHERAAFG